MLLDRLARVTDQLRTAVAALDPERLSGPDAARLLAAFAEVERLAVAGRLLSARRVESSNVWRRSGHRSAAAHVAEATGTGIGPAITALEAARHLGSLPATDEAVRQGRLSETQVKEIAGAAILQPEAEQSLVDAAGQQPMSVLKLRCKRVRAAGQDPLTSYSAIHRGRYLRNWVEDSGAVRLDARLTPDEGAKLLASVGAEAARLAAAARRAGVDEPRRALAADALVGLACHRSGAEGAAPTAGSASSGDRAGERSVPGTRPGRNRSTGGPCRSDGPGSVIHVRVDHAALARGRVEGDELCEIPGVGPIPVEVARRLAVDAYLNVLVTDGVDVTTVTRTGRTIPVALRRALEERDPICVVPGCDTREHLEIDHLVPFADGGEVSLANLARLCHWHHYLKTHHGHRLRLQDGGDPGGRPGGWRWIAPDEPPVVPRRIRRSG
jgi:5-methylcytosine-specific restriction endonuclease McrA